MTMTIQLESPIASALWSEAEHRGMSPEQLAQEILHRHVSAHLKGPRPVLSFEQALADSVRENDELLRRLAK